jgi:hypothetical protein
MTERKPDPDACTCGHLAADHVFSPPYNCRLCDCEGFEAAAPLKDNSEPVPYLPVVPLVHLHVFDVAAGRRCRCGITLDGWQRGLHGALADIALGDDAAAEIGHFGLEGTGA